jgi:hypothetical protein
MLLVGAILSHHSYAFFTVFELCLAAVELQSIVLFIRLVEE